MAEEGEGEGEGEGGAAGEEEEDYVPIAGPEEEGEEGEEDGEVGYAHLRSSSRGFAAASLPSSRVLGSGGSSAASSSSALPMFVSGRLGPASPPDFGGGSSSPGAFAAHARHAQSGRFTHSASPARRSALGGIPGGGPGGPPGASFRLDVGNPMYAAGVGGSSASGGSSGSGSRIGAGSAEAAASAALHANPHSASSRILQRFLPAVFGGTAGGGGGGGGRLLSTTPPPAPHSGGRGGGGGGGGGGAWLDEEEGGAGAGAGSGVFHGANPLQRRQHQLHQHQQHQHQHQREAEEDALEEYHEPQLRHGGSIMTSFPPLFEDAAGGLGAGGEFHGAMHRLGVASGSNPMQRQQQQRQQQRGGGNMLLPPAAAAAASRFPALFSPPAEAATARAALGGAGSGSRRGFANVNPLYASSASPAPQPFSPLDRQHHYTSLTAEEQEAARAPSSGHHRASVRQLHSTARVTSRVKGAAGSSGEYF